jgi:tetratricopeptide (TPR) repeat protein
MFFLAKDYEKSALVFEQAREYEKAARLFEKADDYGMAAEMYAKTENWRMAAQMYEKHGNFATAAELFQKVGELARAAANYEKAINHFRAGKMYFELGKTDRAVDLLQRIGPEDPNYIESVLIVNKILAAGGYRTIAIRKLTALLEERGMSEATLDIALTLAEALAAEGENDQAKSWLQRILEVRFPYKNAGDLLQQIERGEVITEDVAEAATVLDEAPSPAPADHAEELLEDLEPMSDSAPVVAIEADFETIRNAALFQELSLQELKKFWTLVEPVEFKAGDLLIEQDRPSAGLIILSAGRVRVVRVDASGHEEKLAELGGGAHLGEMSLLDDSPTSARVVAIEPVKAYRMPKEAFQRLIDSDDRLARKIYQAFAASLMARLRDTNEQFKSFRQKQQNEIADLFGIKG